MSRSSAALSVVLTVFPGALLAAPFAARGATGTHLEGSTLYPRLIRLHHARRPLKDTLLAKTGNKLFRSVDEGRTFTYLTSVAAAPGSSVSATVNRERCCSTIYELPRKIGPFKAGTLLYSGSFFTGETPAIEVYASTDQGEHWQYLSTPIKAGDQKHGLWEPEFNVAKDHSLIMFFSDETDPCCSQKLVQMRSKDVVHWESKQDTVASKSPTDRPGMAIISRLPNKSYFLSYETCGPATNCQVYFRTSADGLHYGDPANSGIRAVSTTGQYFAHAPANIYDPATRQVLLIGQVLFESDGSVSSQNGRVLFANTALDGSGAWRTARVPVEVPTAYDNYCPNYSSALMATFNGLLELASYYDAAHLCTAYFATLALR